MRTVATRPAFIHRCIRPCGFPDVTGLRTEIEIDAGRHVVWDVLTDFAAYPDWNPFLIRVETRAVPGTPVALRVKIRERILDLDARILVALPERELRWAGPLSAVQALLFRGEHYFVIEDRGPDRVRFVHGENFTGATVPLVGWWLRRNLLPAYVAFNQAIKQRAESFAARRSAPPG